jgi:hypothetical protein
LRCSYFSTFINLLLAAKIFGISHWSSKRILSDESKPQDNKKSELKWRSVELPENIVLEVEELMKEKHERRPVHVPLGLFISDLIQESLDKVHVQDSVSPILEKYAVDSESVYIRDNARDMVAELHFKDESDLYCNVDGAKNCVHIGFAWAIPEVQKMISQRSSLNKKSLKGLEKEENDS